MLLEITFLSPDFHENWCSVMSACLFTKVKQQWATLVRGCVTVNALLVSLMAWQIELEDQNSFFGLFLLEATEGAE